MSVSIQLIPNYVECRGVNTDCNIRELWEFPTLSDYLHLFTLNQHWIDTAGALLCLCPAFCLTNLAAHLKATKQGTKSNDVGEIWRNWMKLDERWWKRGRIRTSYGKASKPQSICQLWHFSLFISHPRSRLCASNWTSRSCRCRLALACFCSCTTALNPKTSQEPREFLKNIDIKIIE